MPEHFITFKNAYGLPNSNLNYLDDQMHSLIYRLKTGKQFSCKQMFNVMHLNFKEIQRDAVSTFRGMMSLTSSNAKIKIDFSFTYTRISLFFIKLFSRLKLSIFWYWDPEIRIKILISVSMNIFSIPHNYKLLLS